MSKPTNFLRLLAAAALATILFSGGSALASAKESSDSASASELSFHGVDVLVLAADRFDKWAAMERHHDEEVGSPAWRTLIRHFADRSPTDALARVNHEINQVRYVADLDDWRSPLDFLHRGGNCKDYAVAKFMLLRGLGYDPSRMHVVGLASRPGMEAHAVLVVETDKGAIVLDSLKSQVYPLPNELTARIVFAVNDIDWLVGIGGSPRVAATQ